MEDLKTLRLECGKTNREIRVFILNLLQNEPQNWSNSEWTIIYKNELIEIRPGFRIIRPQKIELSMFSLLDWKISFISRRIKKKLEIIKQIKKQKRTLKILRNPEHTILLPIYNTDMTYDKDDIEFSLDRFSGSDTLLYFKEADIAMAFKLKWM